MKQKPDVRWPNLPFAEYRARIERAQRCLGDRDIDAMVLFSPTNWWYYGGFTDAAQMHNAIWRVALIVSQDHDPVAVAESTFLWVFAHTSWVEDVRFHGAAPHPTVKQMRAGEDFYDVLQDTLRDLGLTRATLGFETGPEVATYLSIDEFEEIRWRLPEAAASGQPPELPFAA